jgi:CRISPR/Cas system-associated protein Csm6
LEDVVSEADVVGEVDMGDRDPVTDSDEAPEAGSRETVSRVWVRAVAGSAGRRRCAELRSRAGGDISNRTAEQLWRDVVLTDSADMSADLTADGRATLADILSGTLRPGVGVASSEF